MRVLAVLLCFLVAFATSSIVGYIHGTELVESGIVNELSIAHHLEPSADFSALIYKANGVTYATFELNGGTNSRRDYRGVASAHLETAFPLGPEHLLFIASTLGTNYAIGKRLDSESSQKSPSTRDKRSGIVASVLGWISGYFTGLSWGVGSPMPPTSAAQVFRVKQLSPAEAAALYLKARCLLLFAMRESSSIQASTLGEYSFGPEPGSPHWYRAKLDATCTSYGWADVEAGKDNAKDAVRLAAYGFDSALAESDAHITDLGDAWWMDLLWLPIVIGILLAAFVVGRLVYWIWKQRQPALDRL